MRTGVNARPGRLRWQGDRHLRFAGQANGANGVKVAR